ncbi:MAG: NUDIX hydrolase [Sphaerochaeta sp.]|uniref:NUDIX hydrolase n=1 Tax=Sphaerochaeta sp. TaxID=1972642 RepID=UPI002FCC7DAA
MFDPFAQDSGKTNDHLIWKSGTRKTVFHGPIFDVCTIDRASSDGRQSVFIEVESPNWVTVIPWFRDANGVPHFVMVEQFRHGSATITREFPAGVVEKGELPRNAALRELQEETGLAVQRLTELGNVSPNSAFMTNRSYFYLAERAEHVHSQALDANEQLEVLSVPVATVVEQMGTGIYDNGIMMIALGFFLREARKRPSLIATQKE